jgi:very-short-patch-repair endonuclease
VAHRVSEDCGNSDETLSCSSFQAFCPVLRFFLRHLESIQGEERDVIILSFCYGRDQQGKFEHNFGWLTTRPEGERRLNVAITRARQKLVLVASIHGSDLQTEGKRPIVKHLQDYLNYAERNSTQTEEPTTVPESLSDSGVIEDIYFALQQEGYRVYSFVGCSKFRIDLAVVNDQQPNSFLLGIEVDGRTYREYNTARDRDRLRRKVLEEDLKWQIHRIWSKEWFHDRNTQLNRLIERLQNLKNQCY